MKDDSTKTVRQYSELIHPPYCQEKAATTITTTTPTTPTAILNKPATPTSPFGTVYSTSYRYICLIPRPIHDYSMLHSLKKGRDWYQKLHISASQ